MSWSVSAFAGALLLAILSLPAPAYAIATFSAKSPAPGTTVSTLGSGVSVVAVTSPNQIAQSIPRGFYIDNVQKPAMGVYISQYSETIYGLTWTADVPDGPHTVRMSTTELLGLKTETSWSFTLQAPPTLSAPVPANASTVPYAKPAIGLTLFDNTPGAVHVRLRIDGAQVFDGAANQGAWTWTPTTGFANNSTHTATADVTDAAGNPATLSWSFNVVAGGPMATTCVECHTTYPAVHPMGNCESCHGYGTYHGQGWAPTPAGACLGCHGPYEYHGPDLLNDCGSCHTPASPTVPMHDAPTVTARHTTTTAGCDGCHDKSLITEHGKYPSASVFKYQCSTCHASADPTVQAAIAAKRTDCAACHSTPDHVTLHSSALAVGCAGCHDANLSVAHADVCATCHASSDPKVLAAITAGGATCTSCHVIEHKWKSPSWGAADYYSWGAVGKDGAILSGVGANPANPGVHANYLANTAKCGICHSVHAARGDGVKLLDTATATCIGCHRAGSSTVTVVTVSWQPGGPHGSGSDASCSDAGCHLANPHGAGGSRYKIFAAKLINPAVDQVIGAAGGPLSNPSASGITSGDLNAEATSTWDATTRSTVVAGYTCSISGCHEQTLLPVVDKGWAEPRLTTFGSGNTATAAKTGHVSSGEASAALASFSPVSGCTSCHDQTDAATRSGFTFPHSQTASGASNAGAVRAYLWMTVAASKGASVTPMGAGDKAFDGACLKCHRDTGAAAGIGIDR